MMIVKKTEREAKGKALASSLLLLALMTACLLLTAKPAHAETFAVNSTGDAGDQSRGNGFCNTAPFQVGTEPECTLRAAIEEANATTAADTISFNIGGSGVKTISPASELPRITEAVTIDGYSEPGARPNTLNTGTDAALKIELSGANAVLGAAGLRITGRDSVVKGLIINRFSYGVIIISGTGFSTVMNNKIEGNYIGTDASGTQDLGNAGSGVAISNAPNNTVGGTTAGARNIISGNGDGVSIVFANATENEVLGNYIGTDASGTANLGNSFRGVFIEDASSNTIGGTTAGARNIISGNDEDGVAISGNARGVNLVSNSIFSNGALGIDLLNDNVPNLNDPDDADGGPNNMQNYPVITSAATTSGQTTIKGTLNSIPNAAFTLQFFGSPTADPSGYGEGQTLVGEILVDTDSNGDASFDFATATPLQGGQVVSATATDLSGNTSEFSRAVAVVGTTAPTVSATTPTNGATGVARNISPTATFSEEMDPTTLTTSTAKVYQRVRKKIRRHGKVRRVWRWVPVSAEVSYDTVSKTVTLNPYGTSETLLAPSRSHRVVISTAVKDKAGHALAQNYSWTFTTGIS
ncbi:MAG: Ig-like domain-containing protein [Rubrobacter sp.]|nr:Ig-like domain-containing protein [Rubrobacter sp.]